MQRKTMNRIIVYFMFPSAPFVRHIVGYIALMATPVLWMIGNLFRCIFLAGRSQTTRIFRFQCSFAAVFLVMILIFAFEYLTEHY
jgi:hypothetical protein